MITEKEYYALRYGKNGSTEYEYCNFYVEWFLNNGPHKYYSDTMEGWEPEWLLTAWVKNADGKPLHLTSFPEKDGGLEKAKKYIQIKADERIRAEMRIANELGIEYKSLVKPLKPLVYLGCPYSHIDPKIKEWRFKAVNKVTGALSMQGLTVFSPISMAHPISVDHGLPGDWQFWEKFDTDYLSVCYKMYALMLPGWQDSTGLTAEIKIATKLGLEVVYIDPTEYGICLDQ